MKLNRKVVSYPVANKKNEQGIVTEHCRKTEKVEVLSMNGDLLNFFSWQVEPVVEQVPH